LGSFRILRLWKSDRFWLRLTFSDIQRRIPRATLRATPGRNTRNE